MLNVNDAASLLRTHIDGFSELSEEAIASKRDPLSDLLVVLCHCMTIHSCLHMNKGTALPGR